MSLPPREAPVTDCAVCGAPTVPDDAIVDYAVRGPMVDPHLPPGTVQGMGPARPWTPVDGAAFGNAGSMDFVSADVAVILAHRHGATVVDLTTGETIAPPPPPPPPPALF